MNFHQKIPIIKKKIVAGRFSDQGHWRKKKVTAKVAEKKGRLLLGVGRGGGRWHIIRKMWNYLKKKKKRKVRQGFLCWTEKDNYN